VLIDDQLAAMSANQRSSDGSDAGVELVSNVLCNPPNGSCSTAHVAPDLMLQWR